jgi:hypothetical protein
MRPRRGVDHPPHLASSSSLGATALREPWPPVLFASTGLYPELSFSILPSPSLVGPLERHHHISAEVKERVHLYLYSPSGPSWPVLGQTVPLYGTSCVG